MFVASLSPWLRCVSLFLPSSSNLVVAAAAAAVVLCLLLLLISLLLLTFFFISHLVFTRMPGGEFFER